MLAGVALHAALAYVPYQSKDGHEFAWGFFEFVHGFRMPIFFVLSGYFTAMLWRARGLGGLLSHRIRRIVIPFVVGVLTIVPLVRLSYSAADGLVGGSGAHVPSTITLSHLWFLWFLVWMIAGFAIATTAIDAAKRNPILRVLLSSPKMVLLGLAALPLLTIVPSTRFVDPVFGADLSDTFLPNDGVLAFYTGFFAFGALIFGRVTTSGNEYIDVLGTWWGLQLAVGSFVLFPLGRRLMEENWTASAIVQVAFAWTMGFGLLGLFRTLLAQRRAWVNWLSDSSYWMYLGHFPLVVLGQGMASRLGLPPIVAFPAIFAVSTIALLVSYQYAVRYSPIGTMLNGPRTRQRDLVPLDSPSVGVLVGTMES